MERKPEPKASRESTKLQRRLWLQKGRDKKLAISREVRRFYSAELRAAKSLADVKRSHNREEIMAKGARI